MNEKLKLILGGLGFGLLLLFAFVGVKSMLSTGEKAEVEAISAQSTPPPIIGLPGEGGMASSTNDVTKPEETPTDKLELVGEPKTPGQTETPPAPASPAAPPAVVEPPVQEQAPVAQAPVATTGMLDISLQAAEDGSPLDGNVYIQKTNGVNLDKSAYASSAHFSLKPGTYRVTARSEGRGSVSRNLTIAAGGTLNERFRLPLANQPSAPPVEPQPPVTQNPPPNRGIGRLRLVALSDEDGSPLMVNFSIARLDGQVLDSSRHVSFADFVLPAGEFVARFDYHGHQGYKSLSIQDGQNFTYTFNIPAGAGEQRQWHHRRQQQDMPPPDQQPQDMPMQNPPLQQGQSAPGDVLMQQLQQQLLKKLTN